MSSADAGAPMLFLPTQPPLPLPGEGSVRIGRSSASDLVLADADTSRRHAEILCGAEGFTLRDLASTNGTRVNGRRIREHLLRAGDRIGIGASEIVFCRVRTVIDELDDGAATRLREAPAPAWTQEAFQGDLAEIPPYAVIQVLELGRKTGELAVEGDSAEGRLWLRRGEPVHAETRAQLGFDAALSLVCVGAGRFVFQPTLDTPAPTIEASVTQLLLEASRIQDEEGSPA